MISKKLSMSELHHLHGRKHESETRKRDLINYLEKLKEAYRKKQISYARYLEIIHHKRDGRTIEEWIHFYHFESLECHKRIKQHHSHVGKKTHLIFLLACIVGLFLISLIFNNSNFVGFFTQDENASQIIITPYTQGLNINFSENSEYELQLENPGQLNSVRLSGAIQGDGEAKIYLNNILILDTSTLKTGTRTITGLVAENKTKDEKEEKDKEEKVKDDEVTGEVEETQEDTESDGTRDIPIEELEPEIPTIPAEEINETPVEEENQTEVPDSEQEPSSEPETEIRTRTFTDICEESCNLESLNLNESSYTLRIEIDSATINLDEIRYSIIKYPEEAPEEPEEIPTEQEPETPVEEENETLIRELLQESVSQNSSLDIDTTPLDNTTFAMIYASEDKSVYFRVYNTNGTILSNSTIDSTNQPLYPRVAISAINQTHFVVAWINDHDTANNIANITLAIYDINGDKLTGDIIVDDNIAQATADNHFTDLSITQMGDRFVIGWRDDSTDDAQLKIFDNSGNNLTGSILVDPTTAANDALTDTISVSAINSTSFVYGWFDQGVNDLAFNIYNETGGEAVARVNVNPSAATDSRLSIAGLDNDKFVYAFYLSNDQDIGYTIIYKNGTSLIENTIIETNAGPTTGTWLDVAAIKSENYANDSFVLIWYNATAGNIVGATYYGNGTNIATFTIDTEENANYHLMSVVAKESVTGQQICPGTFIVAYSNSSNITTLKQYYINGTIWDGSCGAAVDNSPNVTLSLPEDNYYNDSSSPVNVTFQCNATDDYQLVNMSLYITDSTNSSFALNQTTAISGTSNSTSWNLSLINGNYTWNCLTYDNASQSDWADANRSLKINYTADITSPQINITYPQNTTYSVNVSALNYTYSDDNPGFCWYNNGTINSSAVVAGINFTNITSNEGSNTWTLYCNDTAGNSNQTDVQSFVVQSIPTSLAFSVNQTMYPQGRSPGAGYDIYIPFQARYLDSLGQPISGAICNVTNDETSDITSLTYNESSGNYTGNVSNYLMYDVVNFNVTCSKTNYNSSSNNTSTNVWLFAYLWEWENRSYGSANNYTTTWLRKESTQGNVYNFTEAISASIGENELSKMFYFCGAGTNCSFMKDYNMLGLHTLRL
ncbi:MAG TPA: hypothetical protein VJ438_04990, partial [Candidatus Nanoarchaeia archaeon]|nr:hypothetical protein [Candidatus Nanoarchaeia archaeon]